MIKVFKAHIILILMSIMCIIILIGLTGCSLQIDLGSRIDSELDSIVKSSKQALSSNPYDYIKDSKEYKNIVSQGEKGIKEILAKFEASNENGLKEYIMAAACAEILGEDIEKKTWSSGREWYNNYIKNQKK